ncbi:uncharacterized protein LOC131168588 isoform X2 [Malania oleifera]|nr:uncharacterized protein LOC131168588 isoform X2 [Malania oleifera]XP_057984119.1 uncharacterized protein LOC131168588 isoform X2 [Malania oleifera]XP_057984120.1 uncharacterized protein LOC131168588 isoform X2 [Malania oleifera]
MSHLELERGGHHRSPAGSDGSVCFSDADEGSCHSLFYSTAAGSYDDCRFDCASDPENGEASDSRRLSSVSGCSVEIEVEGGVPEIKMHLARAERDCRICQLSLESTNHESGIPIELGCSCKDDLAAAHKHCAEAWFKIKGNKTCEICNSVASNVAGANEVGTTEQSSEINNAISTTVASATMHHTETQSFWHGHRFLNFLLACMVFAFVLSWLFHFNVPS